MLPVYLLPFTISAAAMIVKAVSLLLSFTCQLTWNFVYLVHSRGVKSHLSLSFPYHIIRISGS